MAILSPSRVTGGLSVETRHSQGLDKAALDFLGRTPMEEPGCNYLPLGYKILKMEDANNSGVSAGLQTISLFVSAANHHYHHNHELLPGKGLGRQVWLMRRTIQRRDSLPLA